MGKISPVSAKYIVHAAINIEGVVDKPGVIGAIFGQTEGLLGSELELRELQRSGRIGRIEVNVDTKGGKTVGVIIVPSSLDKAETSIIGAALEVIERIGPCNAKIAVNKIEDVRVSKRTYVVERAKDLLKNLMDNSMPDSQELADEVMFAVRVMEIKEYGKDRLPAGPAIEDGDEVIVVEGRADVVNLLRQGFKNVIAMNGTSVPDTIVGLSKRKILTVFLDGDRGGDLILKSLLMVADIDYVARAPDGKEVEELAKKEIHQALRARVVPQQVKIDKDKVQHIQQQRMSSNGSAAPPQPQRTSAPPQFQKKAPFPQRPSQAPQRKFQLNQQEKEAFKNMSEELIGTRAAYLLDEKLNILGKVPVSELQLTLKGLSNVYAVVFDGVVDREFIMAAEAAMVKAVVAMDSRIKQGDTPIAVLTINEI
jgi:DNA primase